MAKVESRADFGVILNHDLPESEIPELLARKRCFELYFHQVAEVEWG